MPEPDIRLLVLLVALLLDALVGDPRLVWSRLPHPVVLMGRLIDFIDTHVNRERFGALRRPIGTLAAGLIVTAGLAAGLVLGAGLAVLPGGILVEALLVSVFLAQRSLYEHVSAVADALAHSGLEGGRQAVAAIVGRDPASLDEAGIARAAIESLAENFSDGVVAPAFWYVVAGLPGLAAYKALNTADSMIGHRTPRHEDFGWATARLDDLANFLPARLSGLLVALAAFAMRRDGRAAFAAMRRDARAHTSPNAGWPEAAMAGALHLALAGPRHYAGRALPAAWMNEAGRAEAHSGDVEDALALFIAACLLHAGLAAILWLVMP